MNNKHLIDRSKLEKLIEEETAALLAEMKVSFNKLQEEDAYEDDYNAYFNSPEYKAELEKAKKTGSQTPGPVGKFAAGATDPAASSLFAKQKTIEEYGNELATAETIDQINKIRIASKPVFEKSTPQQKRVFSDMLRDAMAQVAGSKPSEESDGGEVDDATIVQAIQQELIKNPRYKDILMYQYPGEDDGVDNKYGWRTRCAVATFYRDVGGGKLNHNDKRGILNFVKANISKATNTSLLSNAEKDKCKPITKTKTPVGGAAAAKAGGAATPVTSGLTLKYDKERQKKLDDFMKKQTGYNAQDIYFLINGKYSDSFGPLKGKTDVKDFYDYIENWESIKDKKLYYIPMPAGKTGQIYFNSLNSLFSFFKYLETNKRYPDGTPFTDSVDDLQITYGDRLNNETKAFKDYDFYSQWGVYASASSRVTQWLVDNDMTMEELQTSLTGKDYIENPTMEFNSALLAGATAIRPERLIRITDNAGISELANYKDKTLPVGFVANLLDKTIKIKGKDPFDFLNLRFEKGFKKNPIETDKEISDISEFGSILKQINTAKDKLTDISSMSAGDIKTTIEEIKKNNDILKRFFKLPKVSQSDADKVALNIWKFFNSLSIQSDSDVQKAIQMASAYDGKIVIEQKTGYVWHAREYILTRKFKDDTMDENGDSLLEELKAEGATRGKDYFNYFDGKDKDLHSLLLTTKYNITPQDIASLTTDKIEALEKQGKFGTTPQAKAYAKEVWTTVKDTVKQVYQDVKSAPLETALLAYFAKSFVMRENKNIISKQYLEKIILEETYKILLEQEQTEFKFMKDLPKQQKSFETTESTKAMLSKVLSTVKGLGGPLKRNAAFMLILHATSVGKEIFFDTNDEKINSLSPENRKKYDEYAEKMLEKITYSAIIKTFTEDLTTEQMTDYINKEYEKAKDSFLNKTIPSRYLPGFTAAAAGGGLAGLGELGGSAATKAFLSVISRARLAMLGASAGEAVAVGATAALTWEFVIGTVVVGIALGFAPYIQRKIDEFINFGGLDLSTEVVIDEQEKIVVQAIEKIASVTNQIKLSDDGMSQYTPEITKMIHDRYQKFKNLYPRLLPLEQLTLALNDILKEYDIQDASDKTIAGAILNKANNGLSEIELQIKNMKSRLLTPRGLGPLMRAARPNSKFLNPASPSLGGLMQENKKFTINKKIVEKIINEEICAIMQKPMKG